MGKFTNKKFSISDSNLTKVTASVFLVLGLNTNPAAAENLGPENLETIYHIYNNGSYVGAVMENEKVEELVEAKVNEASLEYKELDFEPDESFSVVAEQVFEASVQNEQEVLTNLEEELDVKASTVALTLDGKAIAHLKDRGAYDETIRQLLLSYASPEELEKWEAIKHDPDAVSELKAGEVQITSIEIEEDVSGKANQAEPSDISTPEEAASLLLAAEDITVTVEKQEKVKNGLKHKTSENIVLNDTQKSSVGTGTFAWPAQGGYVSSEKGPRWGSEHKGIDIAQPDGFDIFAADNGVVKAAGTEGTFGKRVIIDHQNGYETIYAHLDSIDVKVGDPVPKGEKIGVMGTTGRSTGIHLHFEISKDGAVQDPLNYVSE